LRVFSNVSSSPWPRAFLCLASKQPVLGNSVLGLGLFQSPWPRRLCPRRHLCWPLRRSIFGTTSSIFYLWSRPWGMAQLLGFRGNSPPTPTSFERFQVAAPPFVIRVTNCSTSDYPAATRRRRLCISAILEKLRQ